MDILRNYSLAQLNTLGIDVNCSYFCKIENIEDLRHILSHAELGKPIMILGGGSNVLFTKNFEGILIQNGILGIVQIADDSEYAYMKVGAGENWHEFVLNVIGRGLCGVENLSLIPGCVGAAPIQNIGAYGVEVKDVFHELEAVNLSTGEIKIFSKEECRFGYRDSIFKREGKNKYAITSVTFRLSKVPKLNTSYGAIEDELKSMGISNPGIKEVSDAVINIRQSKLPDPKEIGNAGSFFKNPEVPNAVFEKIKTDYPALVAYKTSENKMKLAAGWMIEQCGWKGKVVGRVGMHGKQALVLVNYGGASGEELITHARNVQNSVREKFGVEMEMEVNIIE